MKEITQQIDPKKTKKKKKRKKLHKWNLQIWKFEAKPRNIDAIIYETNTQQCLEQNPEKLTQWIIKKGHTLVADLQEDGTAISLSLQPNTEWEIDLDGWVRQCGIQ